MHEHRHVLLHWHSRGDYAARATLSLVHNVVDQVQADAPCLIVLHRQPAGA